jgi:hypothetical protein
MKRFFLKESLTPEQKDGLLALSITVEESVLKLYKYVSTEIQDENIKNTIASLKTKIAEFNFNLTDQATQAAAMGDEGNGIDNNLSDTPNRSLGGDGNDTRLEAATKRKNVRKKLLREKNWKVKLDISAEMIALQEAEDFDPSSPELKALINKLKSYEQIIGQKLGEDEQMNYENLVSDLEVQDDADGFDYSAGLLYDWADDNDVWIGSHGEEQAA